MTRRPLILASTCALALAIAACGGASKSTTGAAGTAGHGADAFPGSTLLFVDANADLNSSAWTKVRALGARFPGYAQIEAKITKALSDTGGNGPVFATDIKPWLGDEVAFGILGVTIAAGSPKVQFGVYVSVTDDAKAVAALTTKGKATKTGEYKGYTEFGSIGDGNSDPMFAAEGKGALLLSGDAISLHNLVDAREGGEQLGGSDRYHEVLGKLPSDNVVVGYADGPKVAQLAGTAVSLLGSMGQDAAGANLAPNIPKAQLDQLVEQLGAIKGLGFSIGAEAGGFRVRMIELIDRSKPGAEKLLASRSLSLAEAAPAGAILYVGAATAGDEVSKAIDQAVADPTVVGQVKMIEAATGLSLKNDIAPLLGGEFGLYVGSGAPPSGALLLKPADAGAAAKSMHRITDAITKLQPGLTFKALPGGVDGQSIDAGTASVSWLHQDDRLVVGVNTGAVPPAGGLSSSAPFTSVRDAAGMPGKVSALVFADVPGAIAFASRVSGEQVPAEAAANLAPLGGVLGWLAADGDTMSAEMFVQVRPAAA